MIADEKFRTAVEAAENGKACQEAGPFGSHNRPLDATRGHPATKQVSFKADRFSFET